MKYISGYIKSLVQLADSFSIIDDKSTINDIKKIINSIDFSEYDFTSLVDAGAGEAYGRNPISSSVHLEIIAMKWPPSSQSLPHDHGQSSGIALIISGEATHIIYNCQLHCVNVHTVKKDKMLMVTTGMIHQMGNSSFSESLITLHFYKPCITRMKVYDLKQQRYAIVSDDCGAWWPKDANKIISSGEL